jgi:hypothetical protein
MPRKRTPSPEQQEQDAVIIGSCVCIIREVSKRYPDRDSLKMAGHALDAFAHSPIEAAKKPRTRKPKAALTAAEMAHAE